MLKVHRRPTIVLEEIKVSFVQHSFMYTEIKIYIKLIEITYL